MIMQTILRLLGFSAGYQQDEFAGLKLAGVSQSPYVPRRCEIHLEDAFLDMTMQKVEAYRQTQGLSTAWTNEGPPVHAIAPVVSYWATAYKWREVEKNANKDFNHYVTTVPGSGNYSQPIPLHFVHQRSVNEEAVPLLLLHGWPSSFLEWSKVVGPLNEHSELPFHVVAPDLPGFGLSPAPKKPGLGPREMAAAFDALMHQLGYQKYGIVTTDVGWIIGMWMVSVAEPSILGHMSDFYLAPPQSDDRARLSTGNASQEEVAYILSFDNWYRSHWGYGTIQGQKPLALSLALADSPVGLLGWYWDVNHATSDGYQYSYEQLITDAMMLWIPGPYANTRIYLEMFKPAVLSFPTSTVPTGVSEWNWGHGPFPDIGDFAFVPEKWIARTSNLVYFERHDAGGHFPAISLPELWIHDVRKFFSKLDKGRFIAKDNA